jgi:hypothetical protein
MKDQGKNILSRIADRLDFDLSDNQRVNLRSNKFNPGDLPLLMEYVHHNMTFVLNMESSGKGKENRCIWCQPQS